MANDHGGDLSSENEASCSPSASARLGAIEAVAELARRLLACQAVAISHGADNGSGTVARDPAGPVSATIASSALTDPLSAQEHGLEFYAGLPLYGAGGRCIGFLAALDESVRELRDHELESLRMTAKVVAELLDPLEVDAQGA